MLNTKCLKPLFGMLFAISFAASAHAGSGSMWASPTQQDTTDYNIRTVAFNGQNVDPANAQPVTYQFCHKWHGGLFGCKNLYCHARVSMSPWAGDPSAGLLGKKGWKAYAGITAEHAGCTGGCAPKRNGECDAEMPRAQKASNYFCPLGSQWRDASGVYTSPWAACAQYDPGVRCNVDDCRYGGGGGSYGDGNCPFTGGFPGFDCSDIDCETRTECQGYGGGSPIGCSPYTGYCSATTYDNYANEYNSCIDRITSQNSANAGLGSNDCFCKHTDSSGVRDYAFMFDNGNWKCMKCADGMKQDDATGTSCISRCRANEEWANGACRSCPQGTEAFNATCMPLCDADSGKIRNAETGQCEAICPSGMKASRNGTDATGKAIYSCGCADSRFLTGSFRVPALPGTTSGVSAPTWLYAAALNSSNTDAACVCGDASNRTSLFDQAYVITGNSAALPYGMVPLPAPGNPGRYVCGCPNLNERFMADASGRMRCVAQLTGAGAVLASVENPANPAASGVIAALSDTPNQENALLRGNYDMSDTYKRRVWKCRQGFIRNETTNVCEAINDAMADRIACSDDGVQIAPSSALNGPLATAMSAGGPLAGVPFTKVTNKRLACCLSGGVMPDGSMKPHCTASTPIGFAGGFDDYYDVAGGTNATAKVTFPNRVYLLDSGGRPVTGIFRADGTRCDAGGGGPTAEMSVYGEIARRSKVPATRNTPLGGPLATAALGANPDPQCRWVVRTALEVQCVPNGTRTDAAGNPVITQVTIAGQPRCVGTPGSVTIHYDVVDTSNPNETRRGQFRGLSSTDGGALASPLDIRAILGQN